MKRSLYQSIKNKLRPSAYEIMLSIGTLMIVTIVVGLMACLAFVTIPDSGTLNWYQTYIKYVLAAIPNTFAGTVIAYALLPLNYANYIHDIERCHSFTYNRLLNTKSGLRMALARQWLTQTVTRKELMLFVLFLAMITQWSVLMYLFSVQFIVFSVTGLYIINQVTAQHPKLPTLDQKFEQFINEKIKHVRQDITQILIQHAKMAWENPIQEVAQYADSQMFFLKLSQSVDKALLGLNDSDCALILKEGFSGSNVSAYKFFMDNCDPIANEYDDFIDSKLVKRFIILSAMDLKKLEELSPKTQFSFYLLQETIKDSFFTPLKLKSRIELIFDVNFHPDKKTTLDWGYSAEFSYIPQLYGFRELCTNIAGVGEPTLEKSSPFIEKSILAVLNDTPILENRKIDNDLTGDAMNSRPVTLSYDYYYWLIVSFFARHPNVIVNRSNVKRVLGIIADNFFDCHVAPQILFITWDEIDISEFETM